MVIRISALALACVAVVSAQDSHGGTLPELAPPFVVEAGGAPIRVATGHAAPFVVDLDGDGTKDLVVGQFDGGKARVYRNVGTNAAPRFEDFTWLEAGGQPASVPPS